MTDCAPPLSQPASTPSPSDSESSTITYVTNDVVPPTNSDASYRTLVLCFDGTGNQFDSNNSNVVQFFSMLCKDEPDRQLVYYQSGIGTYTIPDVATPFWSTVAKTIDMMLGNHLDAHVMGGYEFLMQNYKAGDKICLFGFSRGAYTARALAGMIHKVGLLPRCNHQQVPFAYRMYSQDDELGWSQSTVFKKSFSINVQIEFVGVWDTVNSVGLIPHRLPFTKTNNNIRYFRHALSLDERRVRFKANYYNRSTEDDTKLGVQPGEMPRSVRRAGEPNTAKQNRGEDDDDDNSSNDDKPSLDDFEREYSETIAETNVEEVWFAGCHGDVGGGSVENGTRNSLARISLRWMIRQCFLAKTGIVFHSSMFKQIGMDWNKLWPEVAQRPSAVYETSPSISSPDVRGSVEIHSAASSQTANEVQTSGNGGGGDELVNEEDEDLADALSPYKDQLVVAPLWWVLEYTPQQLHRQRDDDSWGNDLILNKGKGRRIPMQHKQGVKFHRTVDVRMKADGLVGGEYTPKAKLKPGVTLELVD